MEESCEKKCLWRQVSKIWLERERRPRTLPAPMIYERQKELLEKFLGKQAQRQWTRARAVRRATILMMKIERVKKNDKKESESV